MKDLLSLCLREVLKYKIVMGMKKTEKLTSLIFTIALALFCLISGCNEINTEQPEKSLNSRADIVSEDLPACKCIINPSALIASIAARLL